jgi:hypothetical protein
MALLFNKHRTPHCKEIAAKSAKGVSLSDEGVTFDLNEVLGRSEGPTVQGLLEIKDTHLPRTLR